MQFTKIHKKTTQLFKNELIPPYFENAASYPQESGNSYLCLVLLTITLRL
jgi:hypothetical protein